MNLKLDYCSHEAAKYAVEHWHYSRSLPTPPLLKIGVWENGVFVGVVIFSRGASSNIGKPYKLKQTEICELTRVALKKHEAPTSKIVSIAIKILKKGTKIRLIVSYADSNQNHLGIIYQAGNWIYSGMTDRTYKYIDKFNNNWHGRQVSEKGFNKQYGEKRACPRPSECKKIIQKPKYRYLMPLDEEIRKLIEPLRKPFPKRVRSETSDTAGDQPAEGGAAPTLTLHREVNP